MSRIVAGLRRDSHAECVSTLSNAPQLPAMSDHCQASDRNASQHFASVRLQTVTPGLQSGSALVVPHECLLTVREAAARLGVCTSTVYKLCAEGKLAHLRVSNAIRIAPGHLGDAILARRRTTE